jgi:transglutaminase-like putative cysteine protease
MEVYPGFSVWKQANYPVRIEGIGFGDAVAPNTLKKMKDLINLSIRNYYVRRWAEVITEKASNDEERVMLIYDFLAKKTRYLKDPPDLELIRTPPVSLELIEQGQIPALDCDDLTVLSLALLKSIGFPVAMRAASYTPDQILTHVYGLVKVGQRWIPFDLVKKMGPGWEAPAPTRIMDMEV